MSDVTKSAVEALSAKMNGSFDGSAKFVIENEGSIVIDESGVREGNDETDVTMTADADKPPFLPFALPEIGDEEIAEVVDTLVHAHLRGSRNVCADGPSGIANRSRCPTKRAV